MTDAGAVTDAPKTFFGIGVAPDATFRPKTAFVRRRVWFFGMNPARDAGFLPKNVIHGAPKLIDSVIEQVPEIALRGTDEVAPLLHEFEFVIRSNRTHSPLAQLKQSRSGK